MRIIEKGCDPSIKLAKFKFNCDECDKSIPNPLPQSLNHFMMIVVKPGSSKTTLIMNMICKRGKMYNKKFDRIYLFSPSLGTIRRLSGSLVSMSFCTFSGGARAGVAGAWIRGVCTGVGLSFEAGGLWGSCRWAAMSPVRRPSRSSIVALRRRGRIGLAGTGRVRRRRARRGGRPRACCILVVLHNTPRRAPRAHTHIAS